MEKQEELKQANATEEVVVETKAEETPAETVVEEPKEEAQDKVDTSKMESDMIKQTEAIVDDLVPKAEVDKRVSGMQSAMAKQMDAMKKDYEAKIADFQVQIKAKDEELAKVHADATSLAQKLENFNKELSDLTSALEEKKNALDALNASVNTPNETTDWKSLKGQEFFDWYRKTHK